MRKLNIAGWSGWVVAALVIGAVASGGFQPVQEKTGVVDLNKVIQQSDLGKSNTASLNNALKVRKDLLDFVSTYKVLTTEQAQRMRELSLKATPTEADKQELEKIKKDVQDSDKRRGELSQKQNLTDADRSVLADYAQRIQTMNQVLDRWNQEFTEELNNLESQVRQQTVDRAKASLQEVAKAQGYTIVYEATVAVYGANDLTDATIKAMNAKK